MFFAGATASLAGDWELKLDVGPDSAPIRGSIGSLTAAIDRGCQVRVAILTSGKTPNFIHMLSLDRISVLADERGSPIVVGVTPSYAANFSVPPENVLPPRMGETTLSFDTVSQEPFVLVFTTEGREIVEANGNRVVPPHNWRLGWFSDC
jgi:hypothetical protein